jgi:putative thioredoxin
VSTYIEVSEATFESDVLERSFEQPVVVDFWAEWCGPCRALGPVLEKLAGEADGAWRLAKLDVDSNQQIAAAFGIQGIPAVKAFKDGRVVAEFTGALPEQHVRQWLTQLGPSEADVKFEHGRVVEGRGDLSDARESYVRALDLEPGHVAARKALAALDMRLRSEQLDRDELLERVQKDQLDIDAVTGLADIEAAEGDHPGGVARLIAANERTSGDERDRLRTHLLSLLEPLAVDDPVAMGARKALARVLF